MARTIAQIKEQIAEAFMAEEGTRKLYKLKGTEKFVDVFPTASVESVFFYVFAFGMWIIENLFDRHRAEVNDALANLKPHTLRWYVNKAKAFQIGDELPVDHTGQTVSDVYATIDPNKQIVRYAVAVEEDGVIVFKLAKYISKDDHRPQTLQPSEKDAVRRYFSQIKDAGVPVAVTSNKPDRMKLQMTIYYNAVLLHTDPMNPKKDLYGEQGKEGLVRAAVVRVIENLPFNGTCKKSDIEDAVRGIGGVDVVDITDMQTAPEPKIDQMAVYTPVTGFCIPQSGYFRLEELTLELKPYEHGDQL